MKNIILISLILTTAACGTMHGIAYDSKRIYRAAFTEDQFDEGKKYPQLPALNIGEGQ